MRTMRTRMRTAIVAMRTMMINDLPVVMVVATINVADDAGVSGNDF